MYWAIRIKQDLSNIWSSIHEKPKQCWVWVEKTRCLWKVCKLTKLIKLVLVSDFFYLSFVLFSSTLCSSEGGFHKWCKWFFCLFSVVCVFKRIWIPLYAYEVCLFKVARIVWKIENFDELQLPWSWIFFLEMFPTYQYGVRQNGARDFLGFA